VEFSSSDRLIERLHRLLVVLEDDWGPRRHEMPPLAVYDVPGRRWLLAAGVSLSQLREDPALAHSDANYVMIVGHRALPVRSADPTALMAAFARYARADAAMVLGP
jgi:hypothetical protein